MTTIREVVNTLADKSIRHILPISGGKDSAALAIYMAQEYPQIPVEYVFCDTGAELNETYEYLNQIEALLGKKINRISILDYTGAAKKPTRTPFDHILKELYFGFLPSPQARWCTRLLKIEPFEKFIGNDKAFSYLGIRADENRDGYKPKKPVSISDKANIDPVYPFKDDGITLIGVKEILLTNGVGMPEYYRWRSRSGCYFCFYQQIGEWQNLKKEHPDLYEKAKKYEKESGSKRYTWVQGRSLTDIENLKKEYPVQSVDDAEGCAICHL